MKGYRRFVAYVYEYQKGKKGRNCGFIRVEAREQSCRLEVHLLCPGLTPNVKCEIFGFVRNAGLMDGKRIGSCMTEESRADCVLETDRDSMGGSGTALEKMGGMILTTENGAFFGTEWDDLPIRPENFRRTEKRKKEEILVPDQKKTSEPKQKRNEEKREQAPAEETEKSKETREQVPAEGTEKSKETKEQAPAEESKKSKETKEQVPAEETEKSKKAAEQGLEQESKEEVAQAEQEEKTEQNQKEETEVKAQSVAPSVQPLSVGTPIEAFSDGEIFDCRKIQLRDLAVLYPRDCSVRNNRFVQHGQYHFGHLLFGRNRRGQYILGVPGGYNQQEQFMANMFGFPYFKESRQICLPGARGGYWYRSVNPPKLH